MNAYGRPAAARLAGQGGGVVQLSDGTLRSLTRGQLTFACNNAPADVKLALAKVQRGLHLNEYDQDAVRSYLDQAVRHMH